MRKLIIFLMLLLVPIITFADEADKSEIVKSVMEKLQISDTYDDIQLQPQENGYFLFGYNDNSSVRVNIGNDLVILNYGIYSNNAAVKKLPKISKTEAQHIATAYAVRVASDVIGQLNTALPYTTFVNGGFNVRFERSIDGVTYKADGINIFVNGDTGKVERYDRQFTKTIPFTSAKKIIDDKLARQKYIENNGLELKYNKKIVNKKIYPYLVYVPTADKLLDAVTGQQINIEKKIPSDGYFDVTSMYEKNTGNIDSSDELISVWEAQKIVRSIAQLGIDDGYVARQAKYLKNSNDNYLISLSFVKDKNNISVTLDAKTGIIKEFSKTEEGIVATQDKGLHLEYLNSYMNKYMGEYKDKLYLPIISKDVDTIVVLYERMVNGIPYKSNGIYFVLDQSGNIKKISFAWDDVEFPPLDSIISKAEAYNIFFEKVGLELTYSKISNEKISPVYVPSTMSSGIIDAMTGEILNYDGKKFQQRKRLAYVGLENHYGKIQAEKLADCDIYVSQGNVVLDDNIRQKDYILLISELLPNGKPIIETFGAVTDEQVDTVYNYFVTNMIIDKNEVKPYSYVTRADAVKYLLRVLGYKDVAELNTIFKNHFLDSNEIKPNLRGYIELARGLKLVSGSDGYFKPNDYLTNIDSLIMVYNYLDRGRV